MAASPPRHYPNEVTGRPRGILKNPSSNQRVPQLADHHILSPEIQPDASAQLDEKELTLQNTLQNAGRRRSSADVIHGQPLTRRRSSAADPTEDANMRLKWDEANLYLAEQNRTATMKITEPKTPYAKHYDPSEDDAEMVEEDPSIQVDGIVVDEKDKVDTLRKKHSNPARESDIPGLELGEPEEAVDFDSGIESDRIVRQRSDSGEKHVSVGEGDAEEPVGMPSREEIEKHKKFEEMRKKHYEMKNVKGLLGHPEDVMAEEEEEEDQAPPSMPSSLPSRTINGGH